MRVIIGSNSYCIPAALSAITGLPVDTCVLRIREYLGDQPITGIYIPIALEILKAEGFAVYQWDVQGLTINKFAKLKRSNDLFLLVTRAHALVIHGNTIVDNQFPDGVPFWHYPPRRSHLTQAYRIIPDRSRWPKGPWDNEPDHVDFIHAGFSCILHRVSGGHWCGYVGVPVEHPAFGEMYDEIDVQVHGGLSYAGLCDNPICHVPEPGMPKLVWWLGFDCCHIDDASPSSPSSSFGTYKTVEYVREETENLARQLLSIQLEPYYRHQME